MDEDDLDEIPDDPDFEQDIGDFDLEGAPPEAPLTEDQLEEAAEEPEVALDEADVEEASPEETEELLEAAAFVVTEEAETPHPRLLIRDPAKRIFASRIRKYEKARVLSMRATQIQNGDRDFADEAAEGVTDAAEVARIEYNLGRCPLSILRLRKAATSAAGAIYEVWGVNELTGLSI
jgi:DNA-directed RNA polymerase subunit K/omega